MIWSQLSQAPTLSAAVKRIVDANTVRYQHKVEPMFDIMADQSLGDLLPHLGYVQKPQFYQSWATKGPSLWWEAEHYPYLSMQSQLKRNLPDAVERQILEDGRLHERISTEKAMALWASARNGYKSSTRQIADADAPYYVAVTLGSLPGPKWVETADGSAIERVLPNWPFRYAPTAQPIPLQLQSLMCVDLISWVVLPANTIDNASPVNELVHVSGVGSLTKLRNFANAFHNNKREIFRLLQDNNGTSHGHDHVPARRLDGPQNYNMYYAGPLATSGRAHLVIDHYSVNKPRVGKPFLLVTGLDGLPYWPFFLQLMDIASPFPLEAGWVEEIWAQGLKKQCIIELPSRGVRGFWVRSDDPGWDSIVSKCAGGTGNEVSESIGSVETTLIAPSSGDEGDEDDDEE